jgi:hypothetical protein
MKPLCVFGNAILLSVFQTDAAALAPSTTSPSKPTPYVFIYDPVHEVWETGPSMNICRSTFAAVATPEGKIYAIGGTDVRAYPGKERLSSLLPASAGVYTGKIQDTVEVLDIKDLKK